MEWLSPDYEEIFWQRQQSLKIMRERIDDDPAPPLTPGGRLEDPGVVVKMTF